MVRLNTDLHARLIRLPAFAAYRQFRSALRQAINSLRSGESSVVSLTAPGTRRGHVLLSYIVAPFLRRPGEALPHGHTHFWESVEIAQAWLEMGYDVDVINFTNNVYRPIGRTYSVIIDARHNLERLAPFVSEDCLKIFHVDCAHILFHNEAESRRLLELQRRKGVTVFPRRWEYPNRGIEQAHCATILGGKFTQDTFSYAGKPFFSLPLPSPLLYDWKESADFSTIRRNFLWFGSGGMVHKGLDLVLDAFAGMPDYHLTICGPIDREVDFVRAYETELYHLPNIHTIGWIDISSPAFIKLAAETLAVVYPSCSEGGGGSVIACMHAGMIPIVSYESSVDIDDSFGVLLPDCSVASIQNAVREIADRDPQQLRWMARAAWERARNNFTRDHFSVRYREVIREIESRNFAK